VIGKQLVRCATSVGANYRAVYRAQSTSDFIARLAIVIEECDEAQYWLELLKDQALIEEDRFMNLHGEANDLTAIFVASRKTAVANGPKRQ
jgi:four helix bundle protein